MIKSKQIVQLIVDELLDRVDKEVNAEPTKALPSKKEDLDRDSVLEIAMLIKESLLANGLHIRKHQGKFDFSESIRSTNRNFENLMTRYFDYSKEEIQKITPKQ